MNKSAFASYASEDSDRVKPIVDDLKSHGFKVWRDEDELIAGQDFNLEIKKAFDESPLILCFLSHHSVSKFGFVQKELKWAEQKYIEAPEGAVALIPILLDDDVHPPASLRKLQYLKCSHEGFYEKLYNSINNALKLIPESAAAAEPADVKSDFHLYREEEDGLPGYEAEVYFLDTYSDIYKNADQIGKYINGKLLEFLFSMRQGMLEQDAGFYNFGQPHEQRQNELRIVKGSVKIIGRIMSISYLCSDYFAGAAHSIERRLDFNFFLPKLYIITDLHGLFTEADKAFPILQTEARKQLRGREYADEASIERGTKDWRDFSDFSFTEEGLVISFCSYQVAYYAAGLPEVCVPYKSIKDYIKPFYCSALGIDYL